MFLPAQYCCQETLMSLMPYHLTTQVFPATVLPLTLRGASYMTLSQDHKVKFTVRSTPGLSTLAKGDLINLCVL